MNPEVAVSQTASLSCMNFGDPSQAPQAFTTVSPRVNLRPQAAHPSALRVFSFSRSIMKVCRFLLNAFTISSSSR